jgi:bifunctional DNA-binding transcriptional regulator/antitoxin component of YhaV-PrlF toxin-antitoxin module
MATENVLRTKYGDSYTVKEFDNGKIVFTLNEDQSIILKKYDDESLIKFKKLYDELDELMHIFENPTVGDVTMPKFRFLLKKTERAVERYETLVPKEFREKLNFNKDKLEEIILSLEREFSPNLSVKINSY